MLVTGAVIVAALSFSLPKAASASTTIPASAATCNPDPFPDVHECTSVVGSGLKIKTVTGWVRLDVTDPGIANVHIEIYGPRGHIANCRSFFLTRGTSSPKCTWKNPHPGANMPAGDYCSRSWQKDGSAYYILSVECIGVHR